MVNPDLYTETVTNREYECRSCGNRVETSEPLGYCPECEGAVMNVGVVRE